MKHHQQLIRTVIYALGLLTLSFLAAACGGGADASAEGVATLAGQESTEAFISTEESASSTTDESDGPQAEVSAEQAALDFAACMRDGGIDFPDPTVDADGNPSFQGAFGAAGAGGINPRSEEFRSVREGCQELSAGITFGRGQRNGAGADRTELQDALLPYTECLRGEGLDVGDFTFGAGAGAGAGAGGAGAGGEAAGNGAAAGAGNRPAGQRGGDPAARISRTLGLDAEDPDTAAALETCDPLLESAFANFGPNAQRDGAAQEPGE